MQPDIKAFCQPNTSPSASLSMTEDAFARRAQVLSQAAQQLNTIPAESITTLSQNTSLSEAMVRWAIQTTSQALSEKDFLNLHAAAQQAFSPLPLQPVGLVAVILAGNIFTAALRAVFIPLFFGNRVLIKSSSRETLFPKLMQLTLRQHDPELAEQIMIVDASREEMTADTQMLNYANVVSVYGSDSTIREIESTLEDTSTLLAHGHGLGLAYIDANSIHNEDEAIELAKKLALDIAAYDQHGCLSPHAIYMSPDNNVTPQHFAFLLHKHGLLNINSALPLGTPSLAEQSQIYQWRQIAKSRGQLFADETSAVTFEGQQSMRLSPGFRNIAVYECPSPDAFSKQCSQLGKHLKIIGYHGNLPLSSSQRSSLHFVPIGQMQTPQLGSPQDGLAAFDGYLKV